ncbi:hypothetical protein [Rhodanobacter soli]|uniref:Large polyvalent protein-associated domain-containing protein n=1 Tax=Rhodanobacter soli TaxID=590609 RepID=A0ABV2PYQ1_9GAMM
MKKQKQQTAPEYTTDADGQQLAHVALANTDQRATLYADDYRRLMDAGFSQHWSLNDNGNGSAYVKANGRRADGRQTKLRIARLIAGAGKGEHVRFADSNSLNLRTDNLRIQRAPARYGCGDLLPNAAAVDAAREQQEEQAPTATTRASVLPWIRQRIRRPHNGAARPSEAQKAPTVATEPRQSFTPRVVDVAVLGQRVRQQLAAKGVEVTS